MNAYLSIFKARFLTLFQYRLAALAGMATQVFWGFIKVMILQAFFTYSTIPQPISLSQAYIFVWIGQALLQLLPWNVDKEIEGQIRTGNVAYELVRPLDLYWHWFSRSMAFRLVPTSIRSIPFFLIARIFFELPLPPSITSGILFFISMVFSIFLSSAITTLIIISLFWTISADGIQRLLPHITMILSGMLVPLPLFPDWMQPFLNIQPLRGIIDIPVRLYAGIIPVQDAIYYLNFQFTWLIIFVFLGRWMMNKALKRLVIQGG